MAFADVADLGLAEQEGRSHFCSFRKVPSQASTALGWVDLSMAGGNPLPQYYAASPLEAARLEPFRGLFHGAPKTPSTMHLTDLSVVTPTANCVGRLKLMRYGLYYPFIDGDSLDQQDFVNAVAALDPPAQGWQVMLVAVAPTAGGGSFTYSYMRNGVARTSPTISINTAVTNIASIATSDPAVAAGGRPFLPLNHADSGVDYLTSVTLIAPAGGLFAMVLVDPVTNIATREINTTAEKSFVQLHPGAPRVYDDDYLGFIANCTGSVAAGIYTGYARFAWSK